MKFKRYLNEQQDQGGVETMDDMTALFSFVRKSDKNTGSMKLNRQTINQLIDSLNSLGYESEVHKEAMFFEKKGYYPIEVIYDSARTKGSIYIARQQGRS